MPVLPPEDGQKNRRGAGLDSEAPVKLQPSLRSCKRFYPGIY